MRYSFLLGLILAGSASAGIITYTASLSGLNENPPTGSPGTGTATVTVDNIAGTLTVNLTFSGLVASATAAHIHCCAAPIANVGVAVPFSSFPNATSGTFNNTFDLTNSATYTSTFLNNVGGGTASGAEAALLAGIANDMAYVNIHDATFPGGEIRGFLVPTTPEPATFAIVGVVLVGLAALSRRSRSR
jgi:hypothetical protein